MDFSDEHLRKKYLKSKKEFDKMRNEFENKLDNLIKDFDSFSKFTSPKSWSETGTIFKDLKHAKFRLKELVPSTIRDLRSTHVLNQILDDEDKEYLKSIKKFNL